MKKTILPISLMLLSALSALAQGWVYFSTRVPGTVEAHVYAEQYYFYRTGNTATETPAGTQIYTGPLLTGSGFTAQLFAANGPNQNEFNLYPVPGSLTSFRTGATLGGTIAALVLPVPGVPIHGTGTFQIRAWDNFGGTITSWDLATYRGQSAPFNVSNLGDGVLDFPADLAGFRSFSFYDPNFVPEPSTYALLGLGALGLWLFRRKQPAP